MKEIEGKIYMLRNRNMLSTLPHYAENLFKGVEKAIKESREIEIGGNSILFINRMFTNRFG